MEKLQAIAKAEELISKVRTLVLATQGLDGYPSARIMMNAGNKSINPVYFTCQTGSRKTQEIQKNNKASVYYVAEDNSVNVWLEGEAEVTRDKALREKLWQDYSPHVYPEGVDDPRYTVVVFTPRRLRVSMAREVSEFELNG
ncbi:MAG: pyridoxamine 5'-phosphate oxidase family protein [Clostridiales bacterium]|jgi:general stress protein 26|nr:pyridoxamine 5'-phosphate oxidase family protein [Eubacteriales bacterium]MDH7565798.1 pyridoxamine 5'-phosphate oxidase family protein [Clostridiales bacterium]